MDLMSKGIKVHIVADATTSRTQEDRLLALEVEKIVKISFVLKSYFKNCI